MFWVFWTKVTKPSKNLSAYIEVIIMENTIVQSLRGKVIEDFECLF